MSEKQKDVLEKLTSILPKLPDSKKEYLLGYGDAIQDMELVQENEQDNTTE